MGKRTGGGDLAASNSEMGYYVPRNYVGSKLAPYLGQWLALLLVWPLGALTHAMMSDSPHLPWLTSGLAVGGAVLAGVAWKEAGSRSPMTKAHAALTVVIATAWMVACAINPPWRQPLVGLWFYGGAGVALSWNIRRALRGRDGDGAGGLFEKVKLAGVRTREIEVAPNKVTAPLQLPAGEVTVEEVQAASDKLAGALRLHKGAVRISGDPDDLSQATMTIVPKDVLRHPQTWPGPSAPGGSIVEPLVPGLYEDGEQVRLWLPGDKATARQLTHVQINGMNGSGKSHGGKLAWTEAGTRRDAVLIVLDPSKGEQTVGFLGDNVHTVIGHDACRRFITRVPDVITEQASQLGKWGFDQWRPEVFEQHDMPFIVLWIEEASRVLEDAATLTRIAEEARSAGIALVLSQQKSSFRRMNTDIRSQLGAAWCFGVNSIDDAGFCLSDDAIEAGARPDRWKNRRAGSFYLEAPGIDEERFAMPARTFSTTDSELAAALTEYRDVRPGLWAPTAKLLGLTERPEGARTAGVIAPTTSRATAAVDDLDAMPLPSDEEDATLIELPADPEPDLEGDLDSDLPIDPGMELPAGRPPRRVARQRLRLIVDKLIAEGRTEITVRDLPDPDTTFGRGRSWVSGELAALARDGVLEEAGSDGRATVYRAPAHNAA
ncbi:hypothetical protein FKR81_12660 [Lentzea tibetensis]|uniref:Uncharacterized protein n=1 Tax=Lentzea tibetensis TaxID=2591470 RepID=A0A563EVN2_9PSEU|nr:hypothetical protein [Lentzea tibetensis]TWP51713.1 hypothetical protein FKR81_12660 [Lentzea tibetensis]